MKLYFANYRYANHQEKINVLFFSFFFFSAPAKLPRADARNEFPNNFRSPGWAAAGIFVARYIGRLLYPRLL